MDIVPESVWRRQEKLASRFDTLSEITLAPTVSGPSLPPVKVFAFPDESYEVSDKDREMMTTLSLRLDNGEWTLPKGESSALVYYAVPRPWRYGLEPPKTLVNYKGKIFELHLTQQLYDPEERTLLRFAHRTKTGQLFGLAFVP